MYFKEFDPNVDKPFLDVLDCNCYKFTWTISLISGQECVYTIIDYKDTPDRVPITLRVKDEFTSEVLEIPWHAISKIKRN